MNSVDDRVQVTLDVLRARFKPIADAAAGGDLPVARELLAGVAGDEVMVELLAYLWQHARPKAEGLLGEVSAHRGMGTAVGHLRSQVVTRVRANERAARDEARRSSDRGLLEGQSIGDILGREDLADVEQVEGWALSPAKVYRLRLDPESGQDVEVEVAPCPTLVTQILREPETGHEHWRVEWRVDGDWRGIVESAELFTSANELAKLRKYGLPVGSHNQRHLSAWLATFADARRSSLPRRQASRTFGWVDAGAGGFLWGETCLGGEALFVGDEGQRQRAAAYTSAGDFREWHDAWEIAGPHPRLQLAVYAAVAPLVLGVVDEAPGFIVDWSGRSSGGKSTALQLAASVWGDPARLISKWDATFAGIERLAALSRHLPTFLDDTREAERGGLGPEGIAAVLYMISGRTGKLRGSLEGLRASAELRTVLLSTGERPASSYTEDAGARARTLAVRGFPFEGGPCPENGRSAEAIELTCLEAHGHVGPMVVEHLLARRPLWGDLRDRWRELRARHKTAAGEGSSFRVRAAPYLATLHLAAELVEAACGIPVALHVIEEAARWADASAAEADRELAALWLTLDWCTQHDRSFVRGKERRESPPDPFFGRWETDQGPAVVPAVLREVLAKAQHDPDRVLEEWKRRGWIDLGEGGRIDRRTSDEIFGRRPRLIHLSRAALRAADAA